MGQITKQSAGAINFMLEPGTEEQHDQLKTLKMLVSLLPAIK